MIVRASEHLVAVSTNILRGNKDSHSIGRVIYQEQTYIGEYLINSLSLKNSWLKKTMKYSMQKGTPYFDTTYHFQLSNNTTFTITIII